MHELQRLSVRRLTYAHVLGQVLRLLLDRNFRHKAKPGVVGRGVDHHHVSCRLDALLVQQCRQRLEGLNQGIECGVPVGGALEGDNRLRFERDLLPKGIGALHRRGRRGGGGGRGVGGGGGGGGGGRRGGGRSGGGLGGGGAGRGRSRPAGGGRGCGRLRQRVAKAQR